MATLEDLIAAQRVQADIQQQKLGQQKAEEAAALDTEQAEINPLYDKLISETGQAYNTNIEKARTSASESGVYRSGIRYNKELAIGAQSAQQTGEYGAERTRKLADIARRRSLLAGRTALAGKEIEANLGATVADIRYKDYQQQQAMALEREKMAQAAASAAKQTGVPDRATLFAAMQDDISNMKGIDEYQATQQLYNKYKDEMSRFGVKRSELADLARSAGLKYTNPYAGATGVPTGFSKVSSDIVGAYQKNPWNWIPAVALANAGNRLGKSLEGLFRKK